MPYLCNNDEDAEIRMLLNTFTTITRGRHEHRTVQQAVNGYIDAWLRFEKNVPKPHQLGGYALKLLGAATEQQWEEAEAVATRNGSSRARDTEARYHDRRRTLVKETGYDPW